MAIEVGTNRQALRRMAMVTASSVLPSVLITFVAMAFVFGTDLEAAIPVALAFKFGMTIATVAPALICPVVSWKIVMTLRERDRAQLELRSIAETDQLTGLLNRRGFDAAARIAVSESDPGNPAVSVLMIDIDFFKEVNDSLGHDFGDAALVHVASILRDLARAEAFIAGRQGGEEFIALLPGRTGAEALVIAERLRQACATTIIEHEGKSACVAVSIGIASHAQPVALAQLMSEADDALYRAKRKGRNRAVLHQPVAAIENAA